VGAAVVGAAVVTALVVGATVVTALVVGATVVTALVVGATVVTALVVGATVVGALVVGAAVVTALVVGAIGIENVGIETVGIVFNPVFPAIGVFPSLKDRFPITIDNESTINITKNNKNGVNLKFILLYSIQGKINLSKNVTKSNYDKMNHNYVFL
jgi:hypothetical protein